MTFQPIKIHNLHRDQIEFEYRVVGQRLEARKVKILGCLEMLHAFKDYMESAQKDLYSVTFGRVSQHVEWTLKELHLRILNKWSLPYNEEELCHCRIVPLDHVCQVIRSGVSEIDELARQTRASTSCGSCRPDLQAVLNTYLKL